jgi:hypothetical protein
MKNLTLLALLVAAVVCQGMYGPLLVNNAKAKEAMLTNGKEACDQTGVEKIVEDIEDSGYFVYVLNARTFIASSFPGPYSTNPVIQDAIKAAQAAKDTAVTKSDKNDTWDDKNPLKNIQTLVFASSKDGDSVDYYHFEFHLNLQGRMIGSKEQYLKAHKYLACRSKNEWIQKYLA